MILNNRFVPLVPSQPHRPAADLPVICSETGALMRWNDAAAAGWTMDSRRWQTLSPEGQRIRTAITGGAK